MKVKKGSEYLEGYTIENLERIRKSLSRDKPRLRVHAAMLRKKGKSCREIGETLGENTQTIYEWLRRLEEGGLCRIYDAPSTGRLCKLSNDEQNRLAITIQNSPRDMGYSRDTWTSRILAEHVEKEMGQTYSISGMLALASRLGYSWRVPRPVPYNSATPEEQAKFKEDTKQEMDKYREAGYKICCFDVCAKRDSPTAQRGLRTRGGTETVRTNYSKKGIHIFGVLGENTLDIIFSHTYKSDDTIRMLDHVREKYGKVYCLMDNAGANKSFTVQKRVRDMKGDMVLKYTLPHTPQLNPIEMQWLVVKGAVGGTYFGDFASMQKTIKQALERGEIPVVRLQEYMLGPTPSKDPPSVEVICID